jgi:hypothetical protein
MPDQYRCAYPAASGSFEQDAHNLATHWYAIVETSLGVNFSDPRAYRVQASVRV